MSQAKLLTCAALAFAAVLFAQAMPARAQGIPMERAEMLSAFGERPAFSSDDARVAFAASDTAINDHGDGIGIYLMKLPE